MSSICDLLPREVIVGILSHFPAGSEEVVAVMRVCKEFFLCSEIELNSRGQDRKSINEKSCFNHNFCALDDLRTRWTDKLSVVDNCFNLSKGKRLRSYSERIIDDIPAVSKHLEKLLQNDIPLRCSLLISKGAIGASDTSPSFYEEVALLHRQLKILRLKTIHLQLTFMRLNDKSNEAQYQRYSLRALAILEAFNYKERLKKPPPHLRPIKNIDYDLRTEPFFIKCTHSERVPVEQTVVAAKKALSYYLKAQQKQKSSFWSSPITFVSEYLFPNKDADMHIEAYQRFSSQLLQTPLISEKFALAFAELAPFVKKIDLSRAHLASKDPKELEPFLDDQKDSPITVKEFLSNLCEVRYKQNNDSFLDLECLRFCYNMICEYKSIDKAKLYERVNPYKMQNRYSPYIKPVALQILLKAVASSPTCTQANFQTSLAKLQMVQQFLSENKFQLINGETSYKEYQKMI